jgi:streptogramin lyase
MNHARILAGASLIALALATPAAADQLLTGTITSASGEKMGGVTVTAKAEGSPIATSVYTDESGAYYFPPMPEGKYRVWAQALTYQTAQGGPVELTKTTHKDFALQPMANQEDWIRQLPGDEFLAALPGDTPEDSRMKTQVRKNCTGCHAASYPLQHRFDEEGWYKVLSLMKQVNVLGVYRPNEKPTGNIDFHQRELAKYLARARGPGETSMKFKLRPRPSGEAARVVVKEYDFPMEGGHHRANDGSDWSLGTPSELHHVSGLHDAQMDFNGDIWFTFGHTSTETTIAKIDGKTGVATNFKLDDQRGIATGTHGITRDENGVMWFNTRSHVARGLGGLGRVDPKDGKVTVYLPPRSTTGTAGTIDADLNGNIWVTSPDGALLFNKEQEKFTEYKSVTYKGSHGTATVYGLAADRVGNGWWLLMTEDLVDFGDAKTGKVSEFRLPPDKSAMDALSPDQRKFYDTFQPPDFNSPYAWAQAPRRMGADKNGDYVFTGNSFGGTLAKINIHTKETTLVPLPDPESQQPYQVAVDSNHQVWTNLWSTDKVAKYDPATNKWTLFELPTRGTESRYISVLEQPGKPMQVVVPYSRGRKVGVLTPRSEAELAALKQQVSR